MLAALAALWRFASFRADVLANWRDRVRILRAGLSDRADQELRRLHREIEQRLGIDKDFDPMTVVVDPADMLARVQSFGGLLDTRNRLDLWLRGLGRLGYILMGILLAVVAGDVLTASHLLGLASGDRLWFIALAIDGTALAALVACWGRYVYLMHQLSGAEMLIDEGDTE